ncbi:MAG: trimethylamine methyltransferase family protein, partial [Candidatus Thorarchaeota archaeon]
MTRIQFLSKDEIRDIHSASLEVLEKTGVVISNPDAIDLLRKNGCTIDSETVKFPGSLVEESIKKVPDSFKLFSRDGQDSMEVGGDNILFSPASTAIYFSDRETGEIRRAETPDMVQLARLVDALENIQTQSTAVVPSDVPTSIADLYRIYAILKNSTKPIITGAFSKETMIDNINLLGAVAGGVESLAEKPRAVFDCCPSSPLHWSEDTSQNLIDCATFGIPANIVPAPLMGATGPVTISGTLIQANVEFLSGVVISQLVKPGAIVVSGGAISVLDMRYGTNRMGGIEA